MRHLIVVALVSLVAGPAAAQEIATVDEAGRTVPIPPPVDERFQNAPLPPAERDAIRDRVQVALEDYRDSDRLGGSTYFENEKRWYGHNLGHLYLGDRAAALKRLQDQDHQHQEWHRETAGIDFYACFTIKHQMRKYFQFGHLLDPDYREQMTRGARLWTAEDPLGKPHYAFKNASGWGPDAKNSWVDVRTTDNLMFMRQCAVYLFAEATGNEATRVTYKQRLKRSLVTMYHAGMGEWDSENYIGHTVAPILNLYDFARDEQVKLWAKAGLDFIFASVALKYRDGALCGPTRRDYNHPYPFGGSGDHDFWLWFGAPIAPDHVSADLAHHVASAYHPPLAVLKLGRKELATPVTVQAWKPHYHVLRDGEIERGPEFAETQHLGATFNLGSLTTGTGHADVNGLKLVCRSSARGADVVVPAPAHDARFAGSPQYQQGKVVEPNRVAQHGDCAVALVADGAAPWVVVLPTAMAVETVDRVTFLRGEATWIALHGINLDGFAIDPEQTEHVRWSVKRKGDEVEKKPHWPHQQVLAARGQGGNFCGLAIEVGEEPADGDYANFKRRVLAEAALEADGTATTGVAGYTASDGRSVRMDFQRDEAQPAIWRDGEPWDPMAAPAVFRGRPISLEWNGDGTLRVEAGGAVFEQTVTKDGAVSWSQE